ncbi:hypothetical protein B0A52_10293 [Exophiala mesophila]|uniref:Uncharacterized protein n=1 Tax=Exophiala mesophila TaxID=212818 RepID=A0A438MQC7_EXOME|nr:hypothetical protein B0A52_10293 [Exophiala mesophila]
MANHIVDPPGEPGGSAPRRLTQAVDDVRQIVASSSTSSESRARSVATARAAIRVFDEHDLSQLPGSVVDQAFIITTLQELAYHDIDGGGITDIAEWCIGRWLALSQNPAARVAAFRGLGQAWLARSQSLLARIHRLEGSSSSGSSGRPQSLGERFPYTSSEETRDAERATAEADARTHSPDYVEARGLLIPAVDHYARALELAESQGSVHGDILAEAAEANMSLGNVSSSHGNERYFHAAIRYLRRASDIPGYVLSPYLQSYLDDYGRLVD